MSTDDFDLVDPPSDERAYELWLQHAFGFTMWENVRGYALEQIDRGLSPEGQQAAEKAVDDTLYGLFMLLDRVQGALGNERRSLELDLILRMRRGEAVERELSVWHGDGLCMGFHFWKAGNFGDYPVATPVGATRKT